MTFIEFLLGVGCIVVYFKWILPLFGGGDTNSGSNWGPRGRP